jgi:ribonucleotide reductase alpha subunit
MMQVVKRNGEKEDVSFDKVLRRIVAVSNGLDVNPSLIAQQTLARIYDGVRTTELDEQAARLAFSLYTVHYDYGTLAARIAISNHQRNTEESFSAVVLSLANQVHPSTGEKIRYVSEALEDIIRKHGAVIDVRVNYERDFLFDYFGFKTLERSYLMKDSRGRVLERPQHMWMRVALGIWGDNLEEAFRTYDLMSLKYMTHATPTLFNAGTPRPQLSSCFLTSVEDSITGIYKTLGDCAEISKYAGGIGMHLHNIRAKGSIIRGTNGTSNGLVPMIRVFNNTARYVDQGGGKRSGSFAMYLEPWHADVEDFLRLKLNTGTEEERARDLFYALWVPDLFMERVEADAQWTLFCPSEAPGLADVHGDEFRALYERYEAEGRGRRQVSAQKLWFKVLDSQIETGTPYLLYKDAANKKSNQKNLGTIKSSNLCVTGETRILTDEGERPIRDLAGREVRVWNGSEWSTVTPQQTGADQLVGLVVVKETRWPASVAAGVQIPQSLTNFRFLECTPYHKFILEDGTRVEAKDLVQGQRLEAWITPEGDRVEAEIYTNGHGTESAERLSDTYCFNEERRHAGIFNGILTGNCTEIIEYSSKEETAVCNLASIVLPAFVNEKTRTFDFARLREVVEQIVRNMNAVIDINYYPTPETKLSNMRHRPIGIGVQGLADVFAVMRLAWETEAAAELNQRIFEHIYYAALWSSAEIAGRVGTYETYAGSPMSEGKLQCDLWGVTPLTAGDAAEADRLDWDALRALVARNGVRNSLLLAPMPTASTSQICGAQECMEPFTSNIYARRTLAGEFIVVNKHLMRDLIRYQLWSPEMKQLIVANNGSVQAIPEIPEALKKIYKTSWEIKQRTLIDMAADRGAFICQSQSLNLFVQEPTYAKLTSMHFHSWRKGLKTGIYYLRTKAPVAAQKFTVDPELLAAVAREKEKQMAEEAAADAGCMSCSS